MIRLPAALVCLACGCAAQAETVRFSGELRAGEPFERRLPRGLVFCLLPGGEDGKESWTISIARACSHHENDFAWIATPPYRGAHPRFIEAWHFLPDTKLFSNTRDFRFVLHQRDHDRILHMLRDREHHDAGEILKLARELGQGSGELEITGAEIVPAEERIGTKFVRLRFRVKLTFPGGI